MESGQKLVDGEISREVQVASGSLNLQQSTFRRACPQERHRGRPRSQTRSKRPCSSTRRRSWQLWRSKREPASFRPTCSPPSWPSCAQQLLHQQFRQQTPSLLRQLDDQLDQQEHHCPRCRQLGPRRSRRSLPQPLRRHLLFPSKKRSGSACNSSTLSSQCWHPRQPCLSSRSRFLCCRRWAALR